jgi:MFS family permease
MTENYKKASSYAYFVLAVLTVVYLLNFIDRQIISVLAQNIKEGLHVDDASLGFLYGTAFAVFYAIFGLPFARLADVWNRKLLIAIGLIFWSLMTTLSGFAMSFMWLAIFRIGVGIGEASFVPASVSMLADSFAKEKRATAMGIWTSAVYLGAGAGVEL